jgi:hypothetical protein
VGRGHVAQDTGCVEHVQLWLLRSVGRWLSRAYADRRPPSCWLAAAGCWLLLAAASSASLLLAALHTCHTVTCMGPPTLRQPCTQQHACARSRRGRAVQLYRYMCITLVQLYMYVNSKYGKASAAERRARPAGAAVQPPAPAAALGSLASCFFLLLALYKRQQQRDASYRQGKHAAKYTHVATSRCGRPLQLQLNKCMMHTYSCKLYTVRSIDSYS